MGHSCNGNCANAADKSVIARGLIPKLREKFGSYAKAAQAVGVCGATLHRIDSSGKDMTEETSEKILRAYNAHVAVPQRRAIPQPVRHTRGKTFDARIPKTVAIIEDLKKRFGLTNQSIADLIDVHVNAVSQWSAGRKGPYSHNLEKLRQLHKKMVVEEVIEEVKSQEIPAITENLEPAAEVVETPGQTASIEQTLLDSILEADENELPVVVKMARKVRKAISS